MAFAKGKAKTGGRKAGTPNKATAEIKDVARSLLEDPVYQAKLKQRLRDGKAPQIEQLLYHYAYGKPTDNLKVAREFTLEELVNASMEYDGDGSHIAP